MLEKKKTLRKIIKVRVSAISAEERQKREKLLLDNLFSMPEFISAKTVMLFANLPDEIGTFSLIDKCIALGKRVFLPVINGDEMVACEFKGEYKIGKYEIKEPVVKQLGISVQTSGEPSLLGLSRVQPEITSEASNFRNEVLGIDFALIPGVGYSPDGYRLGRGKGYYDKFLSKRDNLFTVGVCFREQFFLEIPFEPHDVVMKKVLVC